MLRLTQAVEIEVPPILIADIGAMPEGEPRYETLVEQGLATVVGFEPQPEEFARLTARRDPRRRYLPHFLGRGGPAKFHVTRYPGCSSLYEPDAELIDRFTVIGYHTEPHNFHVERTLTVDTVRLDDVRLDDGGELPPVDLIALDTQGSELDILAGGERVLAGALVVETEVEFVPLYRAQPLFGDLHTALASRGFLLHKLVDVAGSAIAPVPAPPNPYMPISQLLWAEAVFVRDFRDLARFSDPDLVKAAVILNDVYRSFDLSALLLAELDRRHGGDRRERYAQALNAAEELPLLVLNIREPE